MEIDAGYQTQFDNLKDPVGLFFYIAVAKVEDLIVHSKDYYIRQTVEGMKVVQDYEPSKAFMGTDVELQAEATRRVEERWARISNPPRLIMERAPIVRKKAEEGRI